MHSRLTSLCLGVAMTPGLALIAHAQYAVTVLQNPVGQVSSLPFALNASGESVGWSQPSGGGSYDAVLWSATGTPTVLQDSGGIGVSQALAINASGQSVGISVTSNNTHQAVLWSASGQATVLADLAGHAWNVPNALNNAGQSVGYSSNPSSGNTEAALWAANGSGIVPQHGSTYGNAVAINASGQSVGYSEDGAFLWSESGAATPLQGLSAGYAVGEPLALNNAGQSVGYSVLPTGGRAVLWSPTGTVEALQLPAGQVVSGAVAINASGQSVGYARNANCDGAGCYTQEAVLWSPSGQATVLQNSDGAPLANAVAINDAGYSVGWLGGEQSGLDSTEGAPEAVVWSPNGTVTNLSTLLNPAWNFSEAVGINDNGDILGYGGVFGTGVINPFILTPLSAAAPEPSTWAMLLAGFAGLGFLGYRRAKTIDRSISAPCSRARYDPSLRVGAFARPRAGARWSPGGFAARRSRLEPG